MDSLGQVLAAAIVLAGGVFACVCLLAVINLLLPGLVEPIRRRIDQGLLWPFLVGLGTLIVFGGAWVALLAALVPGGKPAAVAVSIGIVFGFVCLVLAGLAVVTIYGLTALAAVMGQRQSTGRGPFRDVLFGGLVMFLACLAPVVGWVLFTPFAICTSLGAGLMALFSRGPGPQGASTTTPGR